MTNGGSSARTALTVLAPAAGVLILLLAPIGVLGDDPPPPPTATVSATASVGPAGAAPALLFVRTVPPGERSIPADNAVLDELAGYPLDGRSLLQAAHADCDAWFGGIAPPGRPVAIAGRPLPADLAGAVARAAQRHLCPQAASR